MKFNVLLFACLSCWFVSNDTYAQKFSLMRVTRTRVLIDSTYDVHPDSAASCFLHPYQHLIDSVELSQPVIGRCLRPMSSYKPESALSNLLSDILLNVSSKYGEKPDFSVYNM